MPIYRWRTKPRQIKRDKRKVSRFFTASAPTITSSSSASVEEGNTTVLTVTAIGTGSITFSIIGGADQSKFSINVATGGLTFVSPPDYETPTDANTDNVYIVQVGAGNSAGITSQTITVAITDVVETTSGNKTEINRISVGVGLNP